MAAIVEPAMMSCHWVECSPANPAIATWMTCISEDLVTTSGPEIVVPVIEEKEHCQRRQNGAA